MPSQVKLSPQLVPHSVQSPQLVSMVAPQRFAGKPQVAPALVHASPSLSGTQVHTLLSHSSQSGEPVLQFVVPQYKGSLHSSIKSPQMPGESQVVWATQMQILLRQMSNDPLQLPQSREPPQPSFTFPHSAVSHTTSSERSSTLRRRPSSSTRRSMRSAAAPSIRISPSA